MASTHRTRPAAAGKGAPIVRLGDCELNLATRECKVAGIAIQVRRLVFQLLELLIARRPAVVTREEILQTLWKGRATSQNLLARVVLDARRAIGDDASAPRHILNIHGVGYRLASTASEVPAPGASGGDASLAEARRLLGELRADFDPAPAKLAPGRAKAEAALSLALRGGFKVEQGEALCWLAWIALWTSDVETAANYISEATNLAQAESHPLMLARAHTVDAYLRILLGDFSEAMAQLHEAHALLVQADNASDRARCETFMCMASHELQEWEAARHWGAAAIRSAQSSGLRAEILSAEFIDLSAILSEGIYLEQRGATAAQLQAHLDPALLRLDAYIARLDVQRDLSRWIAAVGNRGACLTMLARFEEAHRDLAEIESLVSARGQASGPASQDLRIVYVLIMARLYVREGKPQVALRELQSILDAEPPLVMSSRGPLALELGVEVAEKCARLDIAVRWCRRLADEQKSLQAKRAARLSRILHAQALQSKLTRDLESARRTLYRLERQSADLRQRLAGRPTEP